ncbi:acyltransferase domain-containing protein [Saccharopolyspora sp. MS10]|uniref:acyltransferase domain-containing protein n=1 Tax=Saccharopolyspora sp. MS10 TaxID=3385973 RepID=UPI0039A1E1F7
MSIPGNGGMSSVLPLAAGSAERLGELVEHHLDLALRQGDRPGFGQLCRSAATGRGPHRMAFVADGYPALARQLAEARTTAPPPVAAEPGGVVFVFAGQGSQWAGMGRELLATEPAFRAALHECDRAVREQAGFSVVDELTGSRLREIDVLQPVVVSLQIAWARLWGSWGVRPAAVVGHSMGEIAAAHVCGALDLRDAMTVACRRSALLRRITGKGALAITELSEAAAAELVAGTGGRVSVAGCNGPESTVLAGDSASLDELVRVLEQRGVYCKLIRNTVASHSPQVEELRADLLDALAGLRPGRARVPMRSTATSRVLEGPEITAEYWMSNLREPVRFADAIAALAAAGHRDFLEISPHPVLLSAIRNCLEAAGVEGRALGSGRRDGERDAALDALRALHELGYDPDWRAVHATAEAVASGPELSPYQAALYDAVFAAR